MASYTNISDVAARFPKFIRGGSIPDTQIQEWINENASYLEAVALSRGYNLAAPSADANTILVNLNKLGTQILLGEAIQANMGMTAEWQLLKDIRADYTQLLAAFRKGEFDKLFLPNAATQDPGPQMGGYVPGAAVEADSIYTAPPQPNRNIFKIGKTL